MSKFFGDDWLYFDDNTLDEKRSKKLAEEIQRAKEIRETLEQRERDKVIVVSTPTTDDSFTSRYWKSKETFSKAYDPGEKSYTRHHWWQNGKWGQLAAKCAVCGRNVILEVEVTTGQHPNLDKYIQILMDRHCNPNAHAEKVVRHGFIGGMRTPYVYELEP